MVIAAKPGEVDGDPLASLNAIADLVIAKLLGFDVRVAQYCHHAERIVCQRNDGDVELNSRIRSSGLPYGLRRSEPDRLAIARGPHHLHARLPVESGVRIVFHFRSDGKAE